MDAKWRAGDYSYCTPQRETTVEDIIAYRLASKSGDYDVRGNFIEYEDRENYDNVDGVLYVKQSHVDDVILWQYDPKVDEIRHIIVVTSDGSIESLTYGCSDFLKDILVPDDDCWYETERQVIDKNVPLMFYDLPNDTMLCEMRRLRSVTGTAVSLVDEVLIEDKECVDKPQRDVNEAEIDMTKHQDKNAGLKHQDAPELHLDDVSVGVVDIKPNIFNLYSFDSYAEDDGNPKEVIRYDDVKGDEYCRELMISNSQRVYMISHDNYDLVDEVPILSHFMRSDDVCEVDVPPDISLTFLEKIVHYLIRTCADVDKRDAISIESIGSIVGFKPGEQRFLSVYHKSDLPIKVPYTVEVYERGNVVIFVAAVRAIKFRRKPDK